MIRSMYSTSLCNKHNNPLLVVISSNLVVILIILSRTRSDIPSAPSPLLIQYL